MSDIFDLTAMMLQPFAKVASHSDVKHALGRNQTAIANSADSADSDVHDTERDSVEAKY